MRADSLANFGTDSPRRKIRIQHHLRTRNFLILDIKYLCKPQIKVSFKVKFVFEIKSDGQVIVIYTFARFSSVIEENFYFPHISLGY